MTFEQLLQQMKQLGINMSLVEGKLKVFDPNKNLNPEIMAALKQHKPQLMDFIEQGRGYSGVDFPYATLDNDNLNTIARQYPQLQNIYITTPMQRGMLFHGMVDGMNTGVGASYTTQLSGDLNGELNVVAFKQAWQTVVDRHDVYRTCFVGFDLSMVHQLVLRQAQIPFIELDWQHLDSQTQQHKLQQLRSDDKQQGFDFAKPPLMRITLVKLTAKRHHFIWSQHHALTDGWCGPLVFGEVHQSYQAYCQGQTPQLPDVLPFERYIAWLKKQDQNRARNFFKDSLAAFNAPTPLSFDALANDNQGKTGLVKLELSLDKPTTAALNRFAQQNQCTANALLQAAWSYLLHRYSGENSVLFGSTISGRPADLPGMENMVGLFINTLPVAVHLTADTRLNTLLETLQKDNASREQFGFLSLTDIHEQSSIDKGQPLFDSLLVFENFPTDSALENQGQSSTNNTTPQSNRYDIVMEQSAIDEHTNYAVTLGAFMQDTLLIKIGYRLEQFATAAMARVYQHLERILKHFARLAIHSNGSDIRLGELDYLTENEANQSQIGAVKRKSSAFTPLATQFEAQVIDTKEQTAVVCDNNHLSFSQLNQKANRIAHYMLEQGIEPNDCIGLCLDRSIDTLVAIIAAWKVGAAYVPMEANWPHSRLSYLLDDSQIKLLLTQQNHSNNPAFAGFELAAIDSDANFANFCDNNPQIAAISSDTLAYVIYTSGSTGQPKGVMVTQGNANHFIGVLTTQLQQLNVSSQSPWLMSSSYAFDASVKGPLSLLIGKQVVVANNQQALDAGQLAELLKQHHIEVFNGVPSLASLVLEQFAAKGQQPLALIVGGEALSDEISQQIQQHNQATNSKAINAYGPTELTINATYSLIEANTPVNIGQAVPGATAYVLSDDLTMLPIGAIGELYVAGSGVVAGYLNRPQLTTERFIDNPFSSNQHDTKLYRTGDKVRWLEQSLENGETNYYLDFLGRKDLQVKIRGYRIELGEIEAALLSIDEVNEAKVLVKSDKNRVKTLQAYICAAPEQNAEQLEAHCFTTLQAQLPDPMVPQMIYVLEQMPLTPGGKIDNRALLEYRKPEQGTVQKVAPRTPMEQQLLSLWQQVLNRQDIGVKDNFFDIGGSSILSMQLMALSMQQGIMVNPGLLFQYRTIAELAMQLAPDEKPQHSPEQDENQLILPLNQSNSDIKLFCLPPFGGMASSYALLASKLEPSAQLYGLQAPQLFEDSPAEHTPPSIEQQAAAFIEQIKTVQAAGPYHLLGWSTGGALAYEIANQLQQQDTTQGLIILLDSLPSETAIKNQQQALNGRPTWYSSIRALYGKELELDWDKIATTDKSQAFEQVFDQYIAKQLAPEGVEQQMIRRYLHYIGDFAQALYAHHSKPSELVVDLFQVIQPEDQTRTIEFSDAYNWDLLTNRLKITAISGEHTTLLHSPNVEPLATQIAQKLTQGVQS